MTRSWQDNAHEFGALTKQGYGVRLAVLAACSVEKGAGNGVRKSESLDSGRGSEKVSMAAFAREAGCTDQTVARYLTAWDKMVTAGWDLDRAGLTPDDVNMDLSDEFVTEFDALPKGGHVAKADELGISPGAAAIVNSSSAVLMEAIKADPKTLDAARDAILQVDMARVVNQERVQRIKNDPDLKAMAASHAEGQQVLRAINMFGDAIRTIAWIGNSWNDLMDMATEFERSTLKEQWLQAQSEIGVISMYAEMRTES